MNTAKYIEEHTPRIEDLVITRRQFLNRCGMGFGGMSLAALLGQQFFAGSEAVAAANLSPLTPKPPPFPAKAKRVVHIFAQGAPSQVDTWDPKPSLSRHDGQALPGLQGVALSAVLMRARLLVEESSRFGSGTPSSRESDRPWLKTEIPNSK